MKNLKDVTLVAVDCTSRINGTIQALLYSSREIEFGDIKILSHEIPNNLSGKIKFEQINEITNINEYNQFMFSELWAYIDTTHCLNVQDHAFVINPELWNDNWLKYDYIGSPWPIVEGSYMTDYNERIRVGNGGFSLRSQKLMISSIQLNLQLEQRQGYWNEDGNLTIYHRKELLDYGIKYAPVEVAAKFSFENHVPENEYIEKTFGFHRRHK